MFRMSSFKLSMYQTCPQQYKFTYVDQLADQYKTPKPYLTMGAHVHNTLYDVYQKHAANERSYELMETILRQRWKENRHGFKDLEEERTWGLKALHMLKTFAYKNDLTINPVLLEDYYDMDLTEDIKIVGRIDRVDATEAGLHVIDYKTGKYDPDTISDLQLLLYAMIVQHNLHKPVERASFLYLTDNQWYTVDVTDDMYADIADQLIQEVETIKRDKNFLPQINRYCGSCDFLEICPKAAEIKDRIRLGTLTDGEY